jgi:MFS family permease
MLFRFSLYGFLKNQRYFEPFLYLAFLEKGLDFFLIGLLIAFREIVVNAFEIPSGAIADVVGRRRSMILSFVAYIVSFLIFGLAQSLWMFFLAMFFFGIGEAFRSGTHKAMIFTWLRQQGRVDERTRVYGYTRSWSQIGSALSAVIAALFVFIADGYAWVFFVSAIPCALNVINFLGYPRNLDVEAEMRAAPVSIGRHLTDSLRGAIARPALRRLMFESMGFEGVFAAIKDFLQPVLQATAVIVLGRALADGGLTATQQSAVLVGVVYVVLFSLAATASRQVHRLTDRLATTDAATGMRDGDTTASRWLWRANLILFILILLGGWFDWAALLIPAFVAIHVLQSAWRPVIVSRFDQHSDATQGATILSIESQSQRVATMVVAPLVGYAVDLVAAGGPGGAFWPIGALGAVVATWFVLRPRPKISKNARGF